MLDSSLWGHIKLTYIVVPGLLWSYNTVLVMHLFDFIYLSGLLQHNCPISNEVTLRDMGKIDQPHMKDKPWTLGPVFFPLTSQMSVFHKCLTHSMLPKIRWYLSYASVIENQIRNWILVSYHNGTNSVMSRKINRFEAFDLMQRLRYQFAGRV